VISALNAWVQTLTVPMSGDADNDERVLLSVGDQEIEIA